MRFLLDSCVWGPAAAALRTDGHDVVHAGDWSGDPGDAAILAAAHEQTRILVTLDKDFGELSVVQGAPHFGIIRLSGFRARDQADAALGAARRHERDLAKGAIVSVSPGRVRVRLAE